MALTKKKKHLFYLFRSIPPTLTALHWRCLMRVKKLFNSNSNIPIYKKDMHTILSLNIK